MHLDLALLLTWIFILVLGIPMFIGFFFGAPFVPSPQKACDKMLELAKLKKGMVVVDPGCGDGRLVVAAAKKHGANATGYELFFVAYLMAQWRNMLNGFPAKIRFQDSRKVSLKDVDVIVCYLMPDPLKKLKIKWEKELKPGAKVISYAFEIHGWTPSHVEPKIPEKNIAKIYVYEMK